MLQCGNQHSYGGREKLRIRRKATVAGRRYHRVREAIAAQVFEFWHIPDDENPADILSKHWACNKASHVLRPLVFWRGDTLDCVSLS